MLQGLTRAPCALRSPADPVQQVELRRLDYGAGGGAAHQTHRRRFLHRGGFVVDAGGCAIPLGVAAGEHPPGQPQQFPFVGRGSLHHTSCELGSAKQSSLVCMIRLVIFQGL